MSEFYPRGGGEGLAIFKNVWNSKKSEISDGGGGGKAYLGIFSQNFPFFYDGSPKMVNSLAYLKIQMH